jgi:hypothetical protein
MEKELGKIKTVQRTCCEVTGLSFFNSHALVIYMGVTVYIHIVLYVYSG